MRLIALVVVLRSLIAPGFMLGATADGGLSIMFCNGPAGIHAQHETRSGHSHHHDHDGGRDAGDPGHVTPACTHWSTSGHFVIAALAVPVLSAASPDHETSFPQTPSVQNYLSKTRSTRGPPSLS